MVTENTDSQITETGHKSQYQREFENTLFMILSTSTYLAEYMVILTRVIHEHNSFSDMI